MSATHSRFGAVGLKSRSNQVGGGADAGHRHGGPAALAADPPALARRSASAAQRAFGRPARPQGAAGHARAAPRNSAWCVVDARAVRGPLGVVERPLRRRPGPPCVQAGGRHPERRAEQRDGELGLLRRDEPKHAHRVSPAKKTVACLRISRSCSRRRTRFFSSRSSARSSLVKPSWRSPRSSWS